MTDRPIIFSAPMVRALLEGRKTQTRRLCANHLGIYSEVWRMTRGPEWDFSFDFHNPNRTGQIETCPLGRPGDRLWVRETFGIVDNREFGGERYPEYRADLPSSSTDYPGQWPADEARGSPHAPKWRPSIHMPRWASRLTLVVKDVQAQRLHDITEEDAIAEGVQQEETRYWRDYLMPGTQLSASARDSFETLWRSFHGPDAWDANPWVFAISFDVQQRNIDAPVEATA